jgi:hypothetical protein
LLIEFDEPFNQPSSKERAVMANDDRQSMDRVKLNLVHSRKVLITASNMSGIGLRR